MERRGKKKVEHQLFSKFHDYNYRMQEEKKAATTQERQETNIKNLLTYSIIRPFQADCRRNDARQCMPVLRC